MTTRRMTRISHSPPATAQKSVAITDFANPILQIGRLAALVFLVLLTATLSTTKSLAASQSSPPEKILIVGSSVSRGLKPMVRSLFESYGFPATVHSATAAYATLAYHAENRRGRAYRKILLAGQAGDPYDVVILQENRGRGGVTDWASVTKLRNLVRLYGGKASLHAPPPTFNELKYASEQTASFSEFEEWLLRRWIRTEESCYPIAVCPFRTCIETTTRSCICTNACFYYGTMTARAGPQRKCDSHHDGVRSVCTHWDQTGARTIR